MLRFEPGEAAWVSRLGGLRNVIRQELVARQLADHIDNSDSVLDVGCGQGTQAVRLARNGCHVTGVDASAALLEILRADAAADGAHVETIEAELGDLENVTNGRLFDVVCAHGLLMYLSDRERPLRLLVSRVRPGGLFSLTFRNAAALAFRPGMRGQWKAALDAFGSSDYVNELGVHATADHLNDIVDLLAGLGTEPIAWYGVRVFNDSVAPETPSPSGDELRLLLDAEDRAGRLDPYRALGSQLHLVVRRKEVGSYRDA